MLRSAKLRFLRERVVIGCEPGRFQRGGRIVSWFLTRRAAARVRDPTFPGDIRSKCLGDESLSLRLNLLVYLFYQLIQKLQMFFKLPRQWL
jgi:hypothetical protein